MSYERYMDIFQHHIRTIVEELLRRISGRFREKVFAVIVKLFKLYPRQISEVPEIFQRMLEVLMKELQLTEIDRTIPEQFVLKLLNWVEETLEAERYPPYNQSLVNIVLPLFAVELAENPYLDRLLKISKYILIRI